MPVTEEKQELITVGEAARRFKVQPKTIYRWLEAGLLHKYERELPRRIYVDARQLAELNQVKRTDGDGDE